MKQRMKKTWKRGEMKCDESDVCWKTKAVKVKMKENKERKKRPQ